MRCCQIHSLHTIKKDLIGKAGDSFLIRYEVLMLFLLIVVACLVYSNTLENPFVFDDFPHIPDNPFIRLSKLTFKNVIDAGFESPAPSRPIANISFALNYYFHKYNLAGYHLINILIHLTTGILLYSLLKITLTLPSLHEMKNISGWTPYFTAFIWLVHPLQTQSVTYIVQRMNSMATLFYILSLLLYVRARLSENKIKKRLLFAMCIFSGTLALGTKEISATLPLFILLYDWFFFQDLNLNHLRRNLICFLGVAVFIVFLFFLSFGSNPLETMMQTYLHRDFTLDQRVLTEFRVIIFYLDLLFFPHPSQLNLDHHFPLSHSLINPMTTFWALSAIVCLIVLAFCFAKKERLLSFCILWFLGNLVIESSVIGLEIIFEHRTYLPSMFVILMVVLLLNQYIAKEWLFIAILSAVIIICSLWTYQRNCVWMDSVTLWRDCVKKSPEKARPHFNLGLLLAHRGKIDEAIRYYTEALRIDPDYEAALINLGSYLVERGKIDKAIHIFTKAIQVNPSNFGTHLNLGHALIKSGKLKQGILHYKKALQINPDFTEAHYNLANILQKQGKHDKAIEHYRAVLQLVSSSELAYNNLGVSLISIGNIYEAIFCFQKAVQINPDNKHAQNNLKKAHEAQQRHYRVNY